ncbi:hypothetical protein QM012_008693 [Aureobasidium pullulans]|uniref:Uncharacterized protein n=1 Tax=Aureobasidium pullulans TaxID=5580 RepID=A0ABR0THC8_AURPU
MCYHRYTSHPCGHKSQSIEGCTIDILATQVLFCDHYHVLHDASLKSCGGSYCKEDEETAHWVENGSSLLTACSDDLADLKHRLQTLHRELLAAAQYKEAYGSIQGKEIDRVRSKHEEYVDLRQRFKETRDRRQLILDGIQKAKDKQQAVHADEMRKVQQYVNSHEPRSALVASPQSIPKANQLLEDRRLMKRADSIIPEAKDLSNTPCRPITNLLVSPFKFTPKPSKPQTLAHSSSPSLVTPMSPVDKRAEVDSNPSPRKKRRGNPPRTIQTDELKAQSQDTSEVPSRDASINNDESPVPNNQVQVPRLQPTKRSSKKQSPMQHASPAGVRRSGRTKQRVSYAESPSPSPEHSAPDEPEHDVESVAASQSKRSSRAARATRSNKKLQQDDVYATDEDDDDDKEEDHGLINGDSDWQIDERNGEDDMDIEPTPISKARSSAKRVAASPLNNSRPTKRQATIFPRNTAYRGSDHYDGSELMEINAQHDIPNLDYRWTNTAAQSMISKGAYEVPSTPQNHNMAIENRSNVVYHANPRADGVISSAVNFQSQNPDDPDMSPLRRSDWLNGLGETGMILSLADFHDNNNYDFDVSSMSRVVADFDAQQG